MYLSAPALPASTPYLVPQGRQAGTYLAKVCRQCTCLSDQRRATVREKSSITKIPNPPSPRSPSFPFTPPPAHITTHRFAPTFSPLPSPSPPWGVSHLLSLPPQTFYGFFLFFPPSRLSPPPTPASPSSRPIDRYFIAIAIALARPPPDTSSSSHAVTESLGSPAQESFLLLLQVHRRDNLAPASILGRS